MEHALKNLTGRKRRTFILTVIALLIVIFGNGTLPFAYFWASLRELLDGKDDEDSIKD